MNINNLDGIIISYQLLNISWTKIERVTTDTPVKWNMIYIMNEVHVHELDSRLFKSISLHANNAKCRASNQKMSPRTRLDRLSFH